MKKVILNISVFTMLIMASCKKIVEGFDKDPNRSISTNIPLLLNAGEVGMIAANEGNLSRIGGMWSGSFTGADRQYLSLNNYTTITSDYDADWDNLYQAFISQFLLAEKAALEVNNTIAAGIAEVMLAQGFGLAADLWGDVPFTEVGDPEQFPTPKFEAQADVYSGVQALLDKAIANLQESVGTSPGSKDFFYNGNTTNWIKAAYTLKARYYLHTKNYEAALEATAKGINTPELSIYAPHGSTYLADFNLWYSFLTYDRPAYLTADDAYATQLLDETSDIYRGNAKTNEGARFNYLYQPELNTGGLDPNVLCDFDWGVPTEYTGFFGANERYPILTYYENLLIAAEANLKKATPDFDAALEALNAHRAYLSGSSTYIRSGWIDDYGSKFDPYVAADFASGGMENPDGLPSEEALLLEILEERYISFIGQIEQFNDVRRTKNKLGIPPATGAKLPQRYLYPNSETNTNPNTPKLTQADLFTETPVNATAY
ncbi:MAG: SusD/RagB family nutrient-binding outer membrane lipoprotein [Chitinophagaceae bacterium]|nr:SusD/RagB family nutrient-binding outer membrane lipoprotein [Chitinophagaceae bacterium]MCW5929381.1 SusD/RagB family nutrient-binding outer membrane lipoprotein [Chitinophagaceae bacterium]